MACLARVLSIAVILAVIVSVGACEPQREPVSSATEPVAQPATAPREAPAEPARPEPPPAKEAQPAAAVDVVRMDEVLRFRIDDVEAKYLSQGKPGTSASHWEVADAISPTPKFTFDLADPQALGNVRTVILKFYPMRKDNYAITPAPVIVSADPDNPDIQMKSAVEYDLGALGEDFEVRDARGGVAPRFALRPGFDYKMEVVFKGDPSHIAVIFMQVAN
jgi:hypothetical protein